MEKKTTPDKSLVDKAIDIKGNKYVKVADKVKFFNENYPDGCIQTKMIEKPSKDGGSAFIVKSQVFPNAKDNPGQCFTAYAQQVFNSSHIKGKDLELCETRAVGRCLSMFGIGVIDAMASADDMPQDLN